MNKHLCIYVLLLLSLLIPINLKSAEIIQDKEFLKVLSIYKATLEREEDPSHVINDFRSLAESGNKYSQYMLGTLAMGGLVELSEGLAWLEKADEQGCAGAAGILGFYILGSDASNDKSLGVAYIKRAASLGDVTAQIILASLFKNGTQTINVNLPEAYAWLSLSQMQSEKYKFNNNQSLVFYLIKDMTDDEIIQGEDKLKNLLNVYGLKEYEFCSQSSPQIPK